jgi:hypothetical protein
MTAQGREPTVLPPGLRDRVLDASRQARAVGCPVPEVQWQRHPPDGRAALLGA